MPLGEKVKANELKAAEGGGEGEVGVICAAPAGGDVELVDRCKCTIGISQFYDRKLENIPF